MTTFEAPGPGRWDLDRSHYVSAMTPISAELMGEATRTAYRKLFAELGVPADTIDFRSVNGFTYTRIRPLIGADRLGSKAPPTWLVKLMTRVLPEFRRRTKAAQSSLDDSRWDEVFAEWRRSIRPRIQSENLAFQRVELGQLDDAALADHVGRLLDHARSTFEEHHRLHGYDLGPIGQFAVRGAEWGIDSSDLLASLVGASPSTIEPLNELGAIHREVESAGGTFESLDSIRGASETAAELLEAYLERRGHLLYASYDIDSPTLVEQPGLIARSIGAASGSGSPSIDAQQVAAALRERVPATDRVEFDGLLLDARAAMDMRDDNGPITVEWPAGLLRLGLLEAGRRLAATGRIEQAAHVFELEIGEVVPLITDGAGPNAAQLAQRAARRQQLRSIDPPRTLGPEEPPPPLDALPEAPARLIRIVNAVTEQLLTSSPPAGDGVMSGTGIGSEPFVGVARIADSAELALDELADGEILITRTTSPAYNLVLSIAGGLVTETGGAMCHAAVLSRELGLPAVIGVAGCLERIQPGDRLQLDPASGTVTVLD